MIPRIFRHSALVLLAAGALLAGCAEPPLPRLFWPPPPEEPRVEWIGTFASQDDFPKTAAAKRLDSLLGTGDLAVFKSPFGVAADPERGLVYVSDMHDRNLRVYDMRQHTVHYYSKTPVFAVPRGLALDQAGNLYVADSEKRLVFVFDPDKKPLFTIGGPDLLNTPFFLAINPRLGRLYVSDSQGHKVEVFDLKGRHLFTIGRLGQGEGELSFPQGLAVDAENRLYVADTFNARIQVLDADGNFIRMFGERGDRFFQFEAPKDLAVDSEGNLWVTDNRRGSIYTYTPAGEILLVTGSEARTGHKLGFATPVSIFIDANDRIYVTDLLNRRFAVWQYLSKRYLAEHPITERDKADLQKFMQPSREESPKSVPVK